MGDLMHTCYRCGSQTAKGFMIEKDYTVANQVRWVEGEPQAGWRTAFSGEGGGARTAYRVETWRCAKCGALESFAVSAES
jgi:hypothetical protein